MSEPASELAAPSGSAGLRRLVMEDGRRHETQYGKARAALWCYLQNEFGAIALESELDEIVALAAAITNAAGSAPPNAQAEPRREDAR